MYPPTHPTNPPTHKPTHKHSRDDEGGGEQQRGEQSSLTVCILPLPLVHLSPAVIAAAAHTEEQSDQRYQHNEENPHDSTHHKAQLIVNHLHNVTVHFTLHVDFNCHVWDFKELTGAKLATVTKKEMNLCLNSHWSIRAKILICVGILITTRG